MDGDSKETDASVRERTVRIIAEGTGADRRSAEATADAVLASLRRNDIPPVNHGGFRTSKLTAADIPIIRERGRRESPSTIAKDYHVNRSTISDVIRRKTWNDVPDAHHERR